MFRVKVLLFDGMNEDLLTQFVHNANTKMRVSVLLYFITDFVESLCQNARANNITGWLVAVYIYRLVGCCIYIYIYILSLIHI